MSGSGDAVAGGHAVALAGLPGMGPATLARLLSGATPEDVWSRVCSGEIVRPPRRSPGSGSGGARQAWRDVARTVDPSEAAARCSHQGIEVTWFGDGRYPAALCHDPEPPGVLFWRGDIEWLAQPCVALVGTRRATPDGRTTAFEIGRDLARAGICVISGLALGIDGSAHRGALAARPGNGTGTIGVAASGADRPYPAEHAGLWKDVVAHGAVVSETPPGRPAQAWRFPARNRIIAGLSQMVVVVESHAAGGSLITAEAALARGVDLRAVPGSVRSPASAGTNLLLTEGPAPVRHAGDILDGLGRVEPWPPMAPRGHPGATGAMRATPVPASEGRSPGPAGPSSASERAVLDAMGRRPTTINRIAEVSGRSLPEVLETLDRLEVAGLVGVEGDWWTQS